MTKYILIIVKKKKKKKKKKILKNLLLRMERFASISNIIETAFSSIIIMNNLIKKIHVSNSIHIKKKKKKKKKKKNSNSFLSIDVDGIDKMIILIFSFFLWIFSNIGCKSLKKKY